jgi:hypothetical protein
MEIPSAMKRDKVDTNEPLNSQDLSLPIYAHSSAKERGHLDGLRSLAMQKIFTEQIRQFLISSQRISIFIDGSQWRKIAWNLKGFLHVSVGLVTASEIRPDSHLTISLHGVKLALQLSSVATI